MIDLSKEQQVGEWKAAPFDPHPLLRNGHLQTLAAAFLSGTKGISLSSTQHIVEMEDGDKLAILDDAPENWSPGDPIVVLLHGLCGSSVSHYMCRIASKLIDRGQRAFRVNMRGCGEGQGMARLPYHAGRSSDLASIIEYVRTLCPDSQISVVGFSLGGNVVLKWLGESAASVPETVRRAVAVNPPADLQVCTEGLATLLGGFYDRHFARLLHEHALETPHWHGFIPKGWSSRGPKRVLEFDEELTAPVAGFASAADYYQQSSAARVIGDIRVPTLLLTSRNDPLVPVSLFELMTLPESVHLHVAPCGGHLGYIGRSGGTDPDRHWMDWRVIDWLTSEKPMP
ncbi:MAG: alpha/beta fold hydrolase [Planctomycetaceae bacterium]|nr:alpha/beta fold hydrolase [Planctomycetaceae bacterium]